MLPRASFLLALVAALTASLVSRHVRAEDGFAPGFLCLGESETLMRGTSLEEIRRERDRRLEDLAAGTVARALLPHTHCVVAELMRRVGDSRAVASRDAPFASGPAPFGQEERRINRRDLSTLCGGR